MLVRYTACSLSTGSDRPFLTQHDPLSLLHVGRPGWSGHACSPPAAAAPGQHTPPCHRGDTTSACISVTSRTPCERMLCSPWVWLDCWTVLYIWPSPWTCCLAAGTQLDCLRPKRAVSPSGVSLSGKGLFFFTHGNMLFGTVTNFHAASPPAPTHTHIQLNKKSFSYTSVPSSSLTLLQLVVVPEYC